MTTEPTTTLLPSRTRHALGAALESLTLIEADLRAGVIIDELAALDHVTPALTGLREVLEPQVNELHPATEDLVERFAAALKAKLLAAQVKYGYSNGWQQDDWADKCRTDLAEHVAKGDPLDVAAYAAFAWHHGWPTDPQALCHYCTNMVSTAALSAPNEEGDRACPACMDSMEDWDDE